MHFFFTENTISKMDRLVRGTTESGLICVIQYGSLTRDVTLYSIGHGNAESAVRSGSRPPIRDRSDRQLVLLYGVQGSCLRTCWGTDEAGNGLVGE